MDEIHNSSGKTFFNDDEVKKSGDKLIETRFQTLINSHCQRPFDWYKDLELDKSYASKIRRGIIIPPNWLKIKIAQYFKTDTLTIWRKGEIKEWKT